MSERPSGGDELVTFAIAVFFLIITPGPGVLSTAGVGAAYGVRPASLYVAGLWAGNNMVALAVISGIAAAVLAIPGIRIVLFYASTAYLLYLASRIAFAGSKIAFIQRSKPPGFFGGVLLQAINPKAYVVNTALFSGFAFLPEAPVWEIIIKLSIFNAIWIPIHFGWLGFGIMVHKLDLPQKVQFVINLLMALSMLIVVGLAVFSTQ